MWHRQLATSQNNRIDNFYIPFLVVCSVLTIKPHRPSQWCSNCVPRNPGARRAKCNSFTINFDVLLTVHLSVILVINQLNAQNLVLKCKAVPLQAWTGPEGSRKLRLSDFVTTAQDGGKVVTLTHRPLLPPRNTPGTHFCSRLSRPQGHGAIGRILCQ